MILPISEAVDRLYILIVCKISENPENSVPLSYNIGLAMNCRKHILKFFAGMLLLGVPVLVSAVSLPIKKINGEDYYYYEVKPKETVFGLCRQLNMTKAEIVKYNPSVADGLRAGSILYFPVDVLDGKAVTASEGPAAAVPSSGTTDSHRIPISAASTHHVKKGETVYGICRHYGISEEDLMALNPSLKSGALKQGTLLLLPDTSQSAPSVAGDVVAVVPAEPSGDVAGWKANDDDDSKAGTMSTDSTDGRSSAGSVFGQAFGQVEPEDADTLRISVMLPFMLEQKTPDKQAQFYTEFYKGFMIAVDSLRNESLPLVVNAYDTSNSIDSVYAILQRPEQRRADMILAPDGDDQFRAIASFGNLNRINVMNIFAVKNTDYLTNPYLLQSNIPHSDMYDKAVDGVIESFQDYTIVILSSLDGKTDKNEFVSRLKAKAEDAGRSVKEIPYHGYLKSSDLEQLGAEDSYLFVPASGAHSEFNHVASTLKAFKESRDDYNKAVLFGYPEWITFPEESIENMHFLNSTIYSRFYNDASSRRSKEFVNTFKNWYGTAMANAIPVQGILGFDSGYYIIKALNDNVRHDRNFDYDYDGIQSSFQFVTPPRVAGKVNDSLYFINFRPSGIVDKRIIE